MTRVLHTLVVLLVGLLGAAPLAAEDWTQFRGPSGSGVSPDTRTAVTWSDTENLTWKAPLPGPGSSSPIVLRDRVYVTCFTGASEASGNVDQLERHLLCLDRVTGKQVWDTAVAAEQPEDPYQGMLTEHGYASHSPVTDGERIYTFFGKSGVVAFDLAGNKLWQTSVGKESGRMGWGSGASPILYKDLVIVNASDESQSICALNKRTGQQVWKKEAAGLENAYGTPAVMTLPDGHDELVISVPGEVWGFQPDHGKLLWYAETRLDGTLSASVVARDGVVYTVGGRGRGQGCAVRAGGKGDVSGTHVVWSSNSGASTPSPLLLGEHLYCVSDTGQAMCVQLQTGQLVYREALQGLASRGAEGGARRGGFGGPRSAFYASVVAADNRLYAVSRRNGTFVISAKPQFEQLAHNQFESDDSDFNACPAISNGQLFLRSNKFLYCVAAATQ